jgi:CMP/dCMP kinase
MIVTIDGPAGAGKSTIAHRLAGRLGFVYLDTGAMYRAVALAGLKRGVDFNVPDQLTNIAYTAAFHTEGEKWFLDGQDITQEIRTQDVTDVTRYSAGNPDIRAYLVDLQRQTAQDQDIVTEGRDQGTVVFPAAECKIYLTASPKERARRRLGDLEARGETATLEQILEAQHKRDTSDAAREVGPLAQAEDAIEVDTDRLTIDQVVDKLVELVQSSR